MDLGGFLGDERHGEGTVSLGEKVAEIPVTGEGGNSACNLENTFD